MPVRLSAILSLVLYGSVASAEDIRVKNDGDGTIYRLYAWASDLTPSTDSIIVFPMYKGDVERVTIDNAWDDCRFTFMVDRNSPDDRRKRNFRPKDIVVLETDICIRGSKSISLK